MNFLVTAVSYSPWLPRVPNPQTNQAASTQQKIIKFAKNIFIIIASISIPILATKYALHANFPWSFVMSTLVKQGCYHDLIYLSLQIPVGSLVFIGVTITTASTLERIDDLLFNKIIPAACQEKFNRQLIEMFDNRNDNLEFNPAPSFFKKPQLLTLIPNLPPRNKERLFNSFILKIEPIKEHFDLLNTFIRNGQKLTPNHLSKLIMLLTPKAHERGLCLSSLEALNPDHYTSDEQVKLWIVASMNTLCTQYLLDSGFHIDALNTKNETALEEFYNHLLNTGDLLKQEDYRNFLKNLIAAGAERPKNFPDELYKELQNNTQIYKPRQQKGALKTQFI